MENVFHEFFNDPRYIKIKNSFFNYLNRKKEVKKAFEKNCPLQENTKILDMGCGISPMSPFPDKTLFIDYSDNAVQILKNMGYNAEAGDITNIPKDDNSFDYIVCSEVVEHIEVYKKALSEIYRVLKKDGKLILTVPVHQSYWDVDDEYVGHHRRFDPEQFIKDLKEVGFLTVVEKPIGSYLDRKLTTIAVNRFKDMRTVNRKVGFFKTAVILGVNYCLYILVRLSLLFTSKKTTSIMLFLCKK